MKQPKCLDIYGLTKCGIMEYYSVKKEGTSDICYSMEELWEHYTMWS